MSSPNANGLTDRQSSLVIVAVVCIVAPTIAVSLQLLSRRLCHVKLWWDDYFAVAAMFFAYGPSICVLLSINHGLGRHFNELSLFDVVSIFKTFYPLQILWTINFGLTYITIAALYVRLFPGTKLHTASLWMGTIGLLAAISDIGILIWQCTPIPFFWDKSIPGGHCIKQRETYTGCSSLVLVLVFIMFVLPIPTIFGLHMSSAKKWGLVFTLSLGAFVCITSLFRIITLVQLDNSDISWSAAPIQTWSCLEASFGVVAACLPSLRPLIRMVLDKRTGRKGTGPYSDGTQGTPKAGKFNRVVDKSDPTATLSERVELESAVQIPDDNDDHVRLVNVKKNPNDIMITSQVTQVSDVAHPTDLEKQKREDGILPHSWTTRSPPP